MRSQKIVFTISDDGKKETFPEVVSNLSRAGMNPLLVTNAGIYGTDNRPLGLLISPKGKLHDANTKAETGAAHGNFSWDSAVFQISDDGIASIVPVGNWQDSQHIVAATQSGPQLASAGKINQSFQARSNWSYRRTAIAPALGACANFRCKTRKFLPHFAASWESLATANAFRSSRRSLGYAHLKRGLPAPVAGPIRPHLSAGTRGKLLPAKTYVGCERSPPIVCVLPMP